MIMDRLNQLLVLNWRQKSTARSQLKLAIEDALNTFPLRPTALRAKALPSSSSTSTKVTPSAMQACMRRRYDARPTHF